MSEITYTMPVIWALLIGTAVALYVLLDGFDLGIGILFPFYKEETQRDQIMNSVAPFWDGNETWLVLGGGGLWAAFPKAYAVIMPALYLPVIVMLLALIFRGVAFEFRWAAKPRQQKWDITFAAGSSMATFAQGIVLGGILQEIKVVNGQFAGGAFDWLTPFSLMCGLALVVGYALLGATWLPPGRAAAVRPARLHCIGERMDAAANRPHCRTLVQHSQLLLPVTGAAGHTAPGLAMLARHPQEPHAAAVRVGGRPVPACVCRPGHFERALPGSAVDHAMGCGSPSLVAIVPADRRGHPAADYPGIYGIRLLAVPWQSAAG